ncbi:hypothetical protein [Streptomyces spectabilis]|uniref:Flagellar basal body-associated protein FliL n=1 Tax=Streptomyces spectabilis TaxID=68270 RepID=A0A5P2X8R8_STRST|nr:hypothetical protein [Streptomyces spectabilis]MBB5104125.1 flagellar basal body-associated protein FliL [Streptomyces spectabilis]MCI3903645.1 hypothetical protein [Streptomyces spectabilis]QEV60831.1 hypothetical protein CP982_20650 [Streptomyces spectabilis]GGV39629.1 hypothetical protein GCM10010245_62480 [Streptomyces spectabilis]
MLVLLIVLLVLVLAGFGAVVWTVRGNAPRGVRAAARLTSAAGEAADRYQKKARKNGRSGES